SNTNVATVASNGTVTSVGPGTVTFTFTEVPGGCSSITDPVTVTDPPEVSIDHDTLCVGATAQLTFPGGGSWSTNAPGVATVNGAGLVTAVGVGTAILTYDPGAGCVATITVVVTGSASAEAG